MIEKQLPPEIAEQVVDLNENDVKLYHTATIEAMVTYMKRQVKAESAERIFIMKEVAETKEQIFNFGRVFERVLAELESGAREVFPEIRKTVEENMR